MLFSDTLESTACHRRPLGGILPVCEVPERSHGLENVYIHKVVSSNWVKFLYSVNYPFYTLRPRQVSPHSHMTLSSKRTASSHQWKQMKLSTRCNRNQQSQYQYFLLACQRLQTLSLTRFPCSSIQQRTVAELLWLRAVRLPWAAAWLLSPSLPAAGATTARCYAAPPPSVPPLPLPGGWCPERRMTNASASSYWRIWTTWHQPRTVPTASTRCWLNGRGLAVDWPICVCIGKIWQDGVSVYSIGLCVCVGVCVCVRFHLAQTAYIHHAMALWQRVELRQLH